MSYNILLSEEAQDYYQALDDKSQRIVRENLQKLESEPYPKPGAGSGDREKLVVEGKRCSVSTLGGLTPPSTKFLRTSSR